MTDNLATRPWRSGDLDMLRTSESLFVPQTYPRRFLAGSRRLRPFHLLVSDQLTASARRWTGQVAVAGDSIVALAECAWDPADPESPTVRLNVAEDRQGTRLGHQVLRELVGRCLSIGLPTFIVDYAASNVTVESMLQAIAAEAGDRYAPSGSTRGGLGHLTVRAAS
ncbi:hypothetical protein [Verrucosispora sp. WMMD573]|uniref:hypothetical protein n=1 Tax=Verrucosispora sp. WMMD573 TaxID=3015149 RepID=UPI00248CA97B|nr:hypothetical protein [Verrucosispora sp. WMMD573]WBB53801.1 hypothetical protein O7601_25080 [Verrucosispora sp. WMMD573]